MELNLRGKTALVTGASKGIGRAIADLLAEEGANLVLLARTKADLDQAAGEIRGRRNVRVETEIADLSQTPEVERVGDKWKGVDILINNAGSIPSAGLLDLDSQTWRKAWDLKVYGFIDLTRIVYRAMVGRKAGVIVNVIGGAAHNPRPSYIAGAAGNAALDAFTIALGRESQAHNVRVVGVHPGSTATPRQWERLKPIAKEKLGDAERWKELFPPQPFGRPSEPEEVANLVVFAASDRASHTSGVVFSMTNGI
jgi:NAD(P)-dependent dehydrogenase (short-subunit alcohol dehydrogenase family)